MAKLLSMPVSASLYPEPPYYYPKAEMVIIVFTVDRNDIAGIIPAPLQVPRSPMIMAFVAWYPETTIGPYHEAATLIQSFLKTESGKVEGFYCNSMFVDSDIAFAAGREIWGFPKKLAEMSVKKEGSKTTGLLRRNKIDVMKITVDCQNVIQQLPDASTITLKQIFKPDGSGLELQEFIKTKMEMKAVNIKAGSSTIEFQKSDSDPLYILSPKILMQGIAGTANLVLPYGTVVWHANP